jgi:hypothetical protein
MHDTVLFLVVRYAGVSLAVLGAFLSAPGGTRHLADRSISALRRMWQRLVPVRIVHKQLSDSAVGFDAGLTAHLELSASGAVSVGDRLDDLERRVRALAGSLDELRSELRHLRDVLSREIEPLRHEVRALGDAFNTHIDQETRIDARALPLIGVGVLPSGLPDQAMRHAWVQWALLAGIIAALVTYLSLRFRAAAT